MAGLIGTIRTRGGSRWWERVKGMFGPEFAEAIEHVQGQYDHQYVMTDLWQSYGEPPEPADSGEQPAVKQAVAADVESLEIQPSW